LEHFFSTNCSHSCCQALAAYRLQRLGIALPQRHPCSTPVMFMYGVLSTVASPHWLPRYSIACSRPTIISTLYSSPERSYFYPWPLIELTRDFFAYRYNIENVMDSTVASTAPRKLRPPLKGSSYKKRRTITLNKMSSFFTRLHKCCIPTQSCSMLGGRQGVVLEGRSRVVAS
jgi:hypothetical protein